MKKKDLNTEIEGFFTAKQGVRILNPYKKILGFFLGLFGFFGGVRILFLSEQPLG